MLKYLHLFRFGIQLFFLLSLMFPFGLFPDEIAQWLFFSIALCGVFFCGWVCPFGSFQEWLYFIGRKLRIPNIKLLPKIKRISFVFRLIFLAISILGISFPFFNLRSDFNSGIWIYYKNIYFALILFVSFGALFFERPFCNFFCIYGARYGLLNLIRVLSIRRLEDRCIKCSKCDVICPMNIVISDKTFIRNPNCINCMKCISVCPVNTIKYSFFYDKQGDKEKV